MTIIKNRSGSISRPLLAQLDSRDVALWLGPSEGGELDPASAAMLCRLPWNVVLSESSGSAFIAELERPEKIDDPMVRRRGLIHVIDTDPSETILPPRHLAVLLPDGREGQRALGLAAQTRVLTMLQDLRRRSLKQLVIVQPGSFSVPDGLSRLWADGFRTTLTFVSDDPGAADAVGNWAREFGASLVELSALSPEQFAQELRESYLDQRDGAIVYRVRDERGETRTADATRIDDPERPLLSSYELIEDRFLNLILPSDLTAEEVDGFFADAGASWRPFAAGMPWKRDEAAWDAVRSRLRILDRRGAEESRILYVSGESGAGATTFVRDLAWRAAGLGYPTLVARRGMVPSSGLEMANFLTRMTSADPGPDSSRLYEVPVLIVFDREHWEGRDDDLLSFAREIERSGRRVCILVVTGPIVGWKVLSESRFVQIANLSHRVPSDQALALGHHLNRFLEPHGTARSESEWRDFYNSSSVSEGQGIAAFWIVLSFWLQRQLDLGETVQSRVYRQFRDAVQDDEVRIALLRIAAFSTIRTPLPDALLPDQVDWPVSDKIEDRRRELGPLGLLRIHGELDRSWAMAHDLLGRYLIAGLFYDTPAREALGFAAATNPEHLRFLILRQISALSALGQPRLREVANAFAVSIFKIDPEHGHGSFSPFWREALQALEEMPRSVRTSSRSFLHHSAVSRRRIASDSALFPITHSERVELLARAVADLDFALRLDAPPGSDTDLSLFNSLAHALHDLADAEERAGADPSTVAKTRQRAREATREAYSRNPDNSFVVETYARNLLSDGQDEDLAAARALEVLTLVYSLLERPGSDARWPALSRIAERAFEMLLMTGGAENADPDSESGAIAIAVASLARGVARRGQLQLSDFPKENRAEAAQLLAAPIIAGNVQAVKLRYMLAVLDRPSDFDLQLELLQSLVGSGPAFTAQLQLEYAVLLFQKNRAFEGDRLFRRLRTLWKRGEHFVQVPSRLHWLLDPARSDRRQVRGRVATTSDGRGFARITDFQNVEVPFRATEFADEGLRPGASLAGYIVFNHNGPFLRPLTAPRR